jgi:DNA-binding response OmpR family regulator
MHTPEPISGTILVIDKEERLPQEKAALEQAGFTVITATTAADGLALARERRPDLVISDVMLEKPDAGFVLGHRMKNDPAFADVPLVLLSSVFQEMGIAFDLNSPEGRQWIKADLYLDRPVPSERLVSKVRGLLLHRQIA